MYNTYLYIFGLIPAMSNASKMSSKVVVLFFMCLSNVFSKNCSTDIDDVIANSGRKCDVVVTGVVTEVYMLSFDGSYSVKLLIKRVFKGLSDVRYHRPVIVDGFGVTAICDSDVNVKDTRVFLLRKQEHGHLRLNSSLVRVTLHNLDLTFAAVSGQICSQFIIQ